TFFQRTLKAKTKRAPTSAPFAFMSRPRRLLDFAFDEFDVLLRNRIVFLHLQLFGHRPRVLLGDVIEPGVGAGDKFDLGGDGLGHDNPQGLTRLGRKLRFWLRKSRNSAYSSS